MVWLTGWSPVFWDKEVKKAGAVDLATCMFLTALAKGVAVPSSERAFQALWEFPWQPQMASSQEPFLVVSIWNKKKNRKQSWTSVLFEALFNTFAAWICISFLPSP